MSRVSARLLAILSAPAAQEAEKSQSRTDSPQISSAPVARFDQRGRVQLAVHYDCAASAPTRALAAAGLAVGATVHRPPLCSIEGWLQPSLLPELASLPGIRSLDLPNYSRIIGPVTRSFERPQASLSTAIDGNAVSITHVAEFIATTHKNGTGVSIGVMSDDVTSLALIQSRNELPQHVTLLAPSPQPSPNPAPTDEGTMLLEELHAMAPGARLLFCAPQTDVEYVSCVAELIAAGATVIAEDLEFPAQDVMSAEGSLAQGVAGLLAQNPSVLLFSAAGNENESFWQGAYTPRRLPSPLTCSVNGQADIYAQSFAGTSHETLTLFDTLNEPIYLQWADPFGQNISNFDLYVMDQNLQVRRCIPGAGSREVFAADLDPQLPGGVFHLVIGTPNTEFAGKFLKLIVYGNGSAVLDSTTSGSIASPQKLLSRVVSVGAVYGGDGIADAIEPFSATGPIALEYPTPQSLQAPVLVAPDGVRVDASGTHFPAGSAQLFYGTSAATPNAAAIAALLRAAFPGMSAARILKALQNGAAPLGGGAPNDVFGYGRADAVGALQSLQRPSISAVPSISIVGGSSAQISFTLGGAGRLSVTGQSDNPALVSVGPSAAAQFQPASCGASTNSCSLLITPVLGRVGTAHLSVAAIDGAGRSASASFTITVTTPPPPTVRVMSGGNQSSPSGSPLTPATLTLTGTPHLTVSVTSSNTGLLPASSATLSSGCGTTSLSCIMSIQPAAGKSGQATLTITAQDPYGGSARATLAVSIAPAAGGSSSGGGGTLDPWSLFALGIGLAMARGAVSRGPLAKLLLI